MNLEEQNRSASPTPATGRGSLIVHVTTARGSIPLEGATVNVRNYRTDAERGDVIASLVSGRDGNTPLITLATVPRSETLSPDNGTPFVTYNVEVREEGYYEQSYINVPIFDGIVAIQPADMIPLPENGRTDSRTDSRTPDGERFFESAAPDL